MAWKTTAAGREVPDRTLIKPQPETSSRHDDLCLECWRDTPGRRTQWDRLAERLGNVLATAEWSMTRWRHWRSRVRRQRLYAGGCHARHRLTAQPYPRRNPRRLRQARAQRQVDYSATVVDRTERRLAQASSSCRRSQVPRQQCDSSRRRRRG